MAELYKILWNSRWRRRPSWIWHKILLLPFFSKLCYNGAMFQISSKSGNKWPSYARFSEIQNGGGGHLGCGAEPRFYHFSVKYVATVLHFKFYQNWTINGSVIQDFVKFKMAAAAILDLYKYVRFCFESIDHSPMYLCIKFHQFRLMFDRVIAFSWNPIRPPPPSWIWFQHPVIICS